MQHQNNISQKILEHICVMLNQSRLHLDEEVADASQAVGDAGFGLAQPIVVRDADIVNVF